MRLVSLRYDDDEEEEEENQCEMTGTIRMMIRMNRGVMIRMSENFVDLIDCWYHLYMSLGRRSMVPV